jgi:hypothetical protein
LVRLVYSPAAFSLPSLNAVFSTLVTFVVAVLYLTACWTVSGSTAGAVTMGLWVVLDRQRRSLQDIIFRTRVIYSRPLAS